MDLDNRNKFAAIFAGGILVALFAGAPARADDDTLFGQPAPKQFLLNKMFSPKSLGLTDSSSGGANGQPSGGANGQAAGANGQAAGANGQVANGEPKEEDEDGPGPFPKRYLLNRMFDQGK
jgi:hypothetical protein